MWGSESRAAFWLVVLLGGCKLDLAGGVLLCNHNGKACPDGYHCAMNDYCYRSGQNPDLSAITTDDLAVDDLAVEDQGHADSGRDLLTAQNDLVAPPDLTPLKHQGAACTAGVDVCDTGHCTDGYCCNSDCTDACGACDVTGQLGTCSPVTGPNHGSRACNGSGTCGGICTGSTTSCSYAAASVNCGPSCNGHCDGAGGCTSSGGGSCPGGFACGSGACLTSCAGPADCATNFSCTAPNCVRVAESDCLDGIDNNGDGLIDCADPTCTTVACVPVPVGDDIGYVDGTGCANPNFSTAVVMHQSLGTVLCTGCGCSYTGGSCSFTGEFYTSNNCTTGGTATGTITDPGGQFGTCKAITSGVYSSFQELTQNPVSGGSCSITQQATAGTPSWGVTTNFCIGRQSPSAAACPANQACLAKPPGGAHVCVRVPSAGASCPGGYGATNGTYYASYSAGTCNNCGCTGTTTSCDGSGAASSDSACTSGVVLLEIGGCQPFASVTIKSIDYGSGPSGTCSASTTVATQPAPTGGSTICCQP